MIKNLNHHHHHHNTLPSSLLHDDNGKQHHRYHHRQKQRQHQNGMTTNLFLFLCCFCMTMTNSVYSEIFLPRTFLSVQRKSLLLPSSSSSLLKTNRGGGSSTYLTSPPQQQQQQRRRRRREQDQSSISSIIPTSSLLPFKKSETSSHDAKKTSSNNNNNNNKNNSDKNSSSSSSSNSNNNDNNKLWPPWPFNLFQANNNNNVHDISTTEQEKGARMKHYRTNASLIYSYVKHGLHIGMVQMRQVGSAVTVHLPPSAPPILLLALAPSTSSQTTITKTTEVIKKRTAPLFFTNPSVQKLTLTTIGVAILSWAHSETRKIHRLTPLPLLEKDTMEMNNGGKNHAQSLLKLRNELRKVVLPPYLPEEVVSPPPLLHIPSSNGNGTSFVDIIQEWRNERRIRKYEADVQRRDTTYNELIVLNDLKREKEKKSVVKSSSSSTSKPERKNWPWSGSDNNNNNSGKRSESAISATSSTTSSAIASTSKEPPMGYALITGASRGIGRAIAIELARWNIPLILLARDTTQLSSLASDIETCYGVPCHILSADLSRGVSEARRVHQATTKAKLRVDILVNNAGICHYGNMVDMSPDQVNDVINVNTASVATLSQLYGNDMKKRKRGRIMMVSSIMGLLPSGPGVSLYAATKSFQRSLAISMGRELEKHGVGVTCVCPGAVQTSDLRDKTKNALCWKLPFYIMKPETIAHRSVSSMILGDAELLPGWHNRGFVKGLIPLLPVRLSTMAVEFFWSPWSADLRLPFAWDNEKEGWRNKISFEKKNTNKIKEREMIRKHKEEDLLKYTYPMEKKSRTTTSPKRRSSFWGGGGNSTPTEESLPPRLLSLPIEEEQEPTERSIADDESQKKTKLNPNASFEIQPLSRNDEDTPKEKQNTPKEQKKEEVESAPSSPELEEMVPNDDSGGDGDVLYAETDILEESQENPQESKEIELNEETTIEEDNVSNAQGDTHNMKDDLVVEEHSEELGTEAGHLIADPETLVPEEEPDDKSATTVENFEVGKEKEEETSDPVVNGLGTITEKEENKDLMVDPKIVTKGNNKNDDGDVAKKEKQTGNNASFLQLEFVE